MEAEKKRARSETDKALRRAAMLEAARASMLDEGYDAVTMAGVAKRACVAKGTLYLYFQTKEELFLWLYVELLEEVTLQLEAAFRGPVSDAEFIEALMVAVTDTPLFLPMNARLTSVIEMNTSRDALVDAKREMLRTMPRISAAIERGLGLEAGAGLGVSRAIQVLLQGASQVDLATVSLALDLPEDVRALIETSHFEDVFPEALGLILKGVR